MKHVITFALALIASIAAYAEPLWTPEPDDVYLQEIGSKIETEYPVTDITSYDGTIYFVSNQKMFTLKDDKVEPFKHDTSPVFGVYGFDNIDDEYNGLYYVTGPGFVKHETDGPGYFHPLEGIVDITEHNGRIYLANPYDVFVIRENGAILLNMKPDDGWLSTDTTLLQPDGTQLIADPIRIGPIRGIESYSETLYILRDNDIGLIDDKTFVESPIDWGEFPSRNLRDMVAIGSRLYTATDRGIAQLRGMALTTLDGDDGLPYEDTTCVAKGIGTDLWIGTTHGAIRKHGDEYHYFNGQMWLPQDHASREWQPTEQVNSIHVTDDAAYLATAKGIGIIRYEPYTLAKKADYFEHLIDEWGFMRLGSIHKLWWYENEGEWYREISDNDGGHTAHLLAAMAYKYAATGDPEAREKAVEAFKAMIWLDDVTPKDGFIARSIWSIPAGKGNRGTRGSGGLPAKWYETEDGNWLWKGDTSSDEVNAHYYAVSLFHDLVANDNEKARAAKHLTNITNHIIDNGWVLRDMDGQPTRWGQWSPEYLLTPYGHEAAGLNGMEAQMYVTTAHALSGDQKFADGLQQLLDWGYHKYTWRQKHTFPPDAVVPWDDELAFRSFLPLLTYAKDPALRSIYQRSLERHWEVMRMQKIGFFNFIYGHLTGNDCEVDEAVQHLREWPLDPTTYTYQNSHRADLHPEPGYVPYMGGTKAISPRNSVSGWGGVSAIRLDGGNNARGITPPIAWLEDYWMARYYGMIKPPTTTEKSLTTINPNQLDLGTRAKPYDGPPRPDIAY